MRCFARMASGMKGSLFNTNCHELPVNFRKYFYFLTLISRKPQMTLITRIILSTEFKQITQNFASCCALAASGMLVNYNENVDENGLRIITNY